MAEPTIPPGGDPTPPVELALAQLANEAMKQRPDAAAAITQKLHDVIGHLRANPNLMQDAQDALGQGLDPNVIASKTYQHLQQQGKSGASFGAEPPAPKPQPTPAKTGGMEYMAESVPFVSKATALANAGIDKAEGVPSFWGAYDKRLESLQAGQKQYEATNPKSKTFALAAAGNLIPAVLTMGASEAPEATGLLSTILRGANAGMKFGAVQGLSSAHSSGTAPKVSDYLNEIAPNALLGAVGGGVASGLGTATAAAARRMGLPEFVSNSADALASKAKPGSAASKVLGNVANVFGTRGEAVAKLAPRVQEDIDAGFQAPQAPAGVPELPIDRAGPSVRGQASGIANNTGAGRGILTGGVEQRNAAAFPDIEQALEKGSGVSASDAKTLGPLVRAFQDKDATAQRLFGIAKQQTKGQPVQSPTFDAIRQTDIGQRAEAWALGRRGEMPGGLPIVQVPSSALQQLTNQGVPLSKAVQALGNNAFDSHELPDPEVVHLMKRFMYQVANGKIPGANSKDAADAAGALRQWGKIRKELPPVWQQADDATAAKFRIIDMMNRGRKIYSTPVNPTDENPQRAVSKSLGSLDAKAATASQDEQQALQSGSGIAAQARLNKAMSKQNPSPASVFPSQGEVAQQTAHAFASPQSAADFQNRVDFWQRAKDLENQLTGNSQTAVRGAEQAASAEQHADRSAIRQALTGHPRQALGTLINQNETAAQRAMREKVDAMIARMMVGKNPNALTDAVLQNQLRRSLGANTSKLLPTITGGAVTSDR